MAVLTPSGRPLGRKDPTPDPRDHRFMVAHPRAMKTTAPPRHVNLTSLLTQFDQGNSSSCGAHAISGLSKILFGIDGSRLHTYWETRFLENDVEVDGGVETRDLFKVLQGYGTAPEHLWPFDLARLFVQPPSPVTIEAARRKIASYSRLVTEDEIIRCLASGYPFVTGITLYSSFDGDELARTGVMKAPNVGTEMIIGGHAMCACGYDLDFKESRIFKAAGYDPALVGDVAICCKNSWGAEWGDHGDVWVPILYMTNPGTGGDNWTGRR